MCYFVFVCQAYLKWKKRLSKFGKEPDAETSRAIEESLKQARVTILERKLLDGIKAGARDLDEGKALINTELLPEALDMAKIMPVKDIHKSLWTGAQSILKGKKVVFE